MEKILHEHFYLFPRLIQTKIWREKSEKKVRLIRYETDPKNVDLILYPDFTPIILQEKKMSDSDRQNKHVIFSIS